MIPKFELQSIINKYYLNGLIEAVKWEIKNNKLTIKYSSPNKEMLGELTYDNINLPDSNIGINNTSQLLKLISITSGDVLLDFIKNGKVFSKLIISDNQFTVNYTLADILTVPKTGAYMGSEEYNLEADMDFDSINALIKAKSALAESTTVVLNPHENLDGDFQIDFMFGGDIEYANKVSYFLPNVRRKDTPFDFTIGFSSDVFKEILSANKDASKSKISVNLEGLMKLEFETTNTKSIYYIVKKDI